MSLRLAVVVALAAPACDGQCQEVASDGPGLTGALVYTLGDATRLTASLDRSRVDITARGEVTITGTFPDTWGRDRHYTLRIHDLTPGTFKLAGRGSLCMERQTGAEPVCSEAAGTIEVRQLAYDCFEHESGISACAETRDLTVHATSAWEGTTFELDGVELTLESWVDGEC
jgi:hypothetical protein